MYKYDNTYLMFKQPLREFPMNSMTLLGELEKALPPLAPSPIHRWETVLFAAGARALIQYLRDLSDRSVDGG